MKGQFQIIKWVLQKSFERGTERIRKYHLDIVNSLSPKDFEAIRKTGRLSDESVEALDNSKEEISDSVSLLKALLQGPTDAQLRRHGIKITKVDDGMSVASYNEDFSDSVS